MTHPIVMSRMRKYAIKQAVSELSAEPSAEEIAKVAKHHMLSYPELKQALKAYRKEDNARDKV